MAGSGLLEKRTFIQKLGSLKAAIEEKWSLLVKDREPKEANKIRKGEVVVKAVKGEENVADILTKNTDKVTFKKHEMNLLKGNIVFYEGKC